MLDRVLQLCCVLSDVNRDAKYLDLDVGSCVGCGFVVLNKNKWSRFCLRTKFASEF